MKRLRDLLPKGTPVPPASSVVEIAPVRNDYAWVMACLSCRTLVHRAIFQMSDLERTNLEQGLGTPEAWSCKCIGGRPVGEVLPALAQLNPDGSAAP